MGTWQHWKTFFLLLWIIKERERGKEGFCRQIILDKQGSKKYIYKDKCEMNMNRLGPGNNHRQILAIF
jgi:hypothetical protein